jgi:putative heme-binding domain-containing protein
LDNFWWTTGHSLTAVYTANVPADYWFSGLFFGFPVDAMQLKSLFAFVLSAVLVYAQQPPGGVAPTPKLTPAEERSKIRLPPGFDLQLVASEPDIHKPMNFWFDHRGRIWLTDTVEYPFPAEPGKGRDRVLVLDDFGSDGKARRITVFADGLNIPIGVMPFRDGCIVWSIPNIWFLRDTDGDGRADERKVLYGPFDYVDTHGNINSLTFGFDGWLYACHGFRNDSRVRGTDGHEIHMNSGHVFRMRPDGSRVEIFTRGQVNPFGLAWDDWGNLYSACCHSRPLTQLLRGAVYESFAKPHDGLGFGPHMNDFGQEHSTGLCGLVYYSADHFPTEYRQRLFLGDVVLNRINSYTIEYNGSSPRAVYQPFIVSDDPWFRPVDLRLGPDGAIYIADFYNAIIGHYEVPLTHPKRDRTSGRLWRLVWRGMDGKAPTPTRPYDDLRTEPLEKLGELLAHANLTVRMQVMHELAERGAAAIPMARHLLSHGTSRVARIHALWVLERLGAFTSTEWLIARQSKDAEMRVHVCRLLAERPEITPEERHWLLSCLEAEAPLLRRAAADALGRHPHPDSVNPIIRRYRATDPKDTHLKHALKMALRDHLKSGAVWLVALELPDTLADVIPGAPDAKGVKFLVDLRQGVPSPQEVELIARYGEPDILERWLTRMRDSRESLPRRIEAFQAFRQGLQLGRKPWNEQARNWGKQLAQEALKSGDVRVLEAAADVVASIQDISFADHLAALAKDKSQPAGPRAAACSALMVLYPEHYVSLLGEIVRESNAPAELRERVARSLGTLNRPEARQELLRSFTMVPAGLATQIAVGLAATQTGSEELLEAVATGKASPRLLLEPPVVTLLRQHRLPQFDERWKRLTSGLPAPDQTIASRIQERLADWSKNAGDPAEGQRVFAKHCATCHQIGGQGAKVGPQLDGIGARSPERLLEDILDPNRNVDPAFRSSRITLVDGREFQGLVLRDEGGIVVLADQKGQEIRLEKSKIEERSLSPLSPMPANWIDVLSPEEFRHLLAYLLAQRSRQ